jgi:hypothetical protein
LSAPQCFWIYTMLKEVIRRACPNPSLDTPLTRFSIPPGTMPSLRWWDGVKTPTHHKLPLLGLKLSSNSFLDSSLEDDLSAATVYTIKTTEASTSVFRYANPLEIATLNWPCAGEDNPPLVKMKDCSWSKAPVFLKSGSNPKYVNESYDKLSRFQTYFQQFISQIQHSRFLAYNEMETLWDFILGGHTSYSPLTTLIDFQNSVPRLASKVRSLP